MSWDDLFERADTYGVDPEEIRAALRERRGRE